MRFNVGLGLNGEIWLANNGGETPRLDATSLSTCRLRPFRSCSCSNCCRFCCSSKDVMKECEIKHMFVGRKGHVSDGSLQTRISWWQWSHSASFPCGMSKQNLQPRTACDQLGKEHFSSFNCDTNNVSAMASQWQSFNSFRNTASKCLKCLNWSCHSDVWMFQHKEQSDWTTLQMGSEQFWPKCLLAASREVSKMSIFLCMCVQVKRIIANNMPGGLCKECHRPLPLPISVKHFPNCNSHQPHHWPSLCHLWQIIFGVVDNNKFLFAKSKLLATIRTVPCQVLPISFVVCVPLFGVEISPTFADAFLLIAGYNSTWWQG